MGHHERYSPGFVRLFGPYALALPAAGVYSQEILANYLLYL